jgi:hypothetical protein
MVLRAYYISLPDVAETPVNACRRRRYMLKLKPICPVCSWPAQSIMCYPPTALSLCEGGWSPGRKDLLSRSLSNAVGKWELKFFHKELLDVWTSDEVALLNFDDFQDLVRVSRRFTRYLSEDSYTWMDRNLARWRAAIS